MATFAERRVLRYRPEQRLVHWLGVAAVLILLVTGLALLWGPLSFLAWGGVSPRLHRAAALVFMALPVAYFALNRAKGQELLKEILTYNREDLAWLKGFPAYFLGHTTHLPKQGRLNAGQKLHHLGTFLAFVAVTVSGLLLWFAKGQLGATGLAAAAALHDVSMLAVTILLIGHVYFTFVYGALPSMTTGYVSEGYARLEHARWLEEVDADSSASDAARASQSMTAD